MHLWPEIERLHIENSSCTESAEPWYLFCGEPAVAITDSGPRFADHLPPNVGVPMKVVEILAESD
jgi:hypothetical protein